MSHSEESNPPVVPDSPYFAGFVHFAGVVLGAGLGMLIGRKMPKQASNIAGATAISVGVAATVPLAILAVLKAIGPLYTAKRVNRTLRSIRDSSSYISEEAEGLEDPVNRR